MLPVDFIMHEYLYKYFENIKNLEKTFIHNMRPLSNVSPPSLRPGGTECSSSGSYQVRIIIRRSSLPIRFEYQR